MICEFKALDDTTEEDLTGGFAKLWTEMIYLNKLEDRLWTLLNNKLEDTPRVVAMIAK